jgi:two-component system response regulator MprA
LKLLVVDDNAAIRYGLQRALRMEGYDVELAGDGHDALRAVTAQRPNAIVLDVVMPGLGGLELCRSLRLAGDRTPVLMLTVRDGIADRVAALDAGADDHLGKPFALEELLARVRALLRRSAPEPISEVMEFEHLRLDPASHEAWSGGERLELSSTEFDLLALFLLHSGNLLRRQTIAEHVWGHDLGPASNLVPVYVGYLRRKIELGGLPRLIHTVRGVGYVMRRA